MSDWGATPSWEFALAGLDQESGAQIDVMLWKAEPFTEPLRRPTRTGKLPEGAPVRHGAPHPALDVRGRHRRAGAGARGRHGGAQRVALETARQGIVLLKNDGVLPLAADTPRAIAVIGGHAQLGVPTGTRLERRRPARRLRRRDPDRRPGHHGRRTQPLPPAVVAARGAAEAAARRRRSSSTPGMTPAEAALLARRSDVAIVFAIRVEGEGFDSPTCRCRGARTR